MKIHSVKLQNVRHLKELSFDLPRPLTVIGGPNGAGKTTLQQSILAAMFFCEKQVRDSFVSQFDPDSAPTVVLGLSHGDDAPTIFLTRNLLDDKGEWQENGTVLKKKKQALDKIQEVLPISADAAALLLWGRQDDMPAVVDRFPSDGHTLLTAATIKGSGPDPKAIIKQLEKDGDHARKGERGGQVVGPLIQARNKLAELEDELSQATSADNELRSRRQQLQSAKLRRDQFKAQADEAQARVDRLAQLEKLLVPALKQIETRDQMVAERETWDRLEEDIVATRKEADELHQELDLLVVRYRVARDEELHGQIESLGGRIRLAEELDTASSEIVKDLKGTRRPDPADVAAFQTVQKRIVKDQARLEATGVRYELSAQERPRTLRLSEDGEAAKDIVLAAGESHSGIVGRLTIEADGLRFSAAGKEDITGLKAGIQEATAETRALFKRFAAETDADFLDSAKEKERLQQALEQKTNELRRHLGAATIPGLKTDLQRLEAARVENNMTLTDREACAGKHLPPAAEINSSCEYKRGEIQKAREAIRILEEKRPNEATKNLNAKTLDAIRAKARESAAAFADVDETHREPTRQLGDDIRTRLERERQGQTKLAGTLLEAERKVAELQGQLTQAQPHRALDAIQADLEEAKEACNREETLQEARALLIQRITEKMDSLAAHVPVELGKKVTEHLQRLTNGAAGQVVLSPELAVTHVGGNGAVKPWLPDQLSYGEQHQAALAVKIAVARALAETSGPVFIILDDSLVTFDPQRRAATEDFLLDLVSDEKLQVILLTCHTDWAADWHKRRPQEISYLDLTQCARYYHERVSVATA